MNLKNLPDDITSTVQSWRKSPFDDQMHREVETFCNDNSADDIIESFYDDLSFGTGGLRGILGPGPNRMNRYTVGRATQGLAHYIIEKGDPARGVVIARDTRNMSKEFAQITAEILAANGITVYYFTEPTPTPLVSYGMRLLNAQSGVVITASHNPPQYNGYKVYWDGGGQIIPPVDKELIKTINETSFSSIKKLSFDKAKSSQTIIEIQDDVIDKYINECKKSFQQLFTSAEPSVRIAFSSIHGTGYPIIPHVLGHFNIKNIHVVEEQIIQDGNFPTVTYPNPEEKEAMAQVIEWGLKNNAHCAIATDPDADRMGVAVPDSKGNFEMLTGNEIGAIMMYYLLEKAVKENSSKENLYVVKTIVTSELQQEIADHFGITLYNVLTGFKWIAGKMNELDNEKKTYLFGSEESYGYLPVSFVRDKDSVSSTLLMAAITEDIINRDMTLREYLKEIHINCGLYKDQLFYIELSGIEGKEKINTIMNHFRSLSNLELSFGQLTSIQDYESLKERNFVEDKAIDINDIPSSNVLQLYFNDETKISLRPSGTEPKIKFYISIKSQTKSNTYDNDLLNLSKKISDVQNILKEYIDSIV